MSLLLHPRNVRQLGEIVSGTSLHGYIFHGPVGIGKATSARNLARRINCAQGGDDNCTVCRQIDSGTYPNVIIIRPQDKPSIGIDQIRVLGQMLSLQPYIKSGRRVVIIEEAQAMTTEAQNALLKFIEEPPPSTLLILIALNVQSLLPTVISRLGAIYFLPVEDAAAAAWLMAEHNASSHDAAIAAARSAGRPGLALSLLEADEPAIDVAMTSAVKLTHGTLFARLVEAARIASAKEDCVAVADALHAAAAASLKNESMPPAEVGRIMKAAERMKRYLGSNVTPRSALERFVLEVA